jgi:hypothetical protein
VPLFWGITADGYVAFADDAELLKGACGKSLASFPQGTSTSSIVFMSLESRHILFFNSFSSLLIAWFSLLT